MKAKNHKTRRIDG